jgi:hypothetical protein
VGGSNPNLPWPRHCSLPHKMYGLLLILRLPVRTINTMHKYGSEAYTDVASGWRERILIVFVNLFNVCWCSNIFNFSVTFRWIKVVI